MWHIDEPEKEFHLEEGLHWMEEGELESALESFQRAREAAPEFADVYYYIGYVYDELGEWEQAQEGYNTALRLSRKFISDQEDLGPLWIDSRTRIYLKTLKALALLHYKEEDFGQALSLLGQLLNLNPQDNLHISHYMGECYLRCKMWKEALEFYELTSSSSLAPYNLGLAYFLQGEEERGKEEWKRGIEKNPFMPYYLFGESPPPELDEGREEKVKWEGEDYAERFGDFWHQHRRAQREFQKLWQKESQPR